MMSGVTYVWSLMGMATIVCGFLPQELKHFMKLWMHKLIKKLWSTDPYCRFHFHELDGRGRTNHLYRQVEMHLRSKQLIKDADDLYLSQEESAKKINYTLAGGETVSEHYEGVKVTWTFTTEKMKGSNGGEREENKYTLKMLKTDKVFVMSRYMDYVSRSAKEYKLQLTDLYLYSCSHERWKSHTFQHPSTFDTLAMDPESKDRLMTDIIAYMEGEAYFKRVGRAWKRGYLLYGPPGTGKSSLIAAMANLLHYNIYDLELTQVYDNSMLKALLTNTTSKSIIVIEDVDCSLDLTGSRFEKPAGKLKSTSSKQTTSSPGSRVTLSGLLNFTDGLWSCCGNERIIIFTTNHIEKLDPALLRPGRMDMHIHMSFCNFEIFKVLASNYLSVSSDPLFEQIERFLHEQSVCITPAEVTEILFENKDDTDLALRKLVADLERRGVEGDAVVVKPTDVKDSCDNEAEQDDESDKMEPAVEQDPNAAAVTGEKPCTKIHCNVREHKNQTNWLKIYLDYKSMVQRQGLLGGKRLTDRKSVV